MSVRLIRTGSSHPAFAELVKLLDADLAIRDGDDAPFYAAINKAAMIRHVVVAYDGDLAVGCGAIKAFSDEAMEVKRMFTIPESRGKGIASKVITELEQWTREQGYGKCVLETGINQPEAISLYLKLGYERTPNYGPYANIETSLCFEKRLNIS
jgi:GNAT superfamily N-acetyltransferase